MEKILKVILCFFIIFIIFIILQVALGLFLFFNIWRLANLPEKEYPCWEYGHRGNYDEVIDIEATCESAGLKHRVCSRCGESFDSQPIPAEGHRGGEWITVIDSTLTTNGEEKRVCQVCGTVIEIRTIYAGSKGLTYDYYGEVCFVTGLGGCNDTEIYIPEYYKGHKVTGIKEKAFYGDSSFSSIHIPDTVESIGDYAFYWCLNLESVDMPDSIQSIGAYAFQNCTSLKNIIIPNGITQISDCAFDDCRSLISINIPTGVKTIGYHAFYNCKSARNALVIPDSVLEIKEYSLNYIRKIYYKGSKEMWENMKIGDYAFGEASPTVYYYSETEPTLLGYYWHYVDGVPTEW